MAPAAVGPSKNATKKAEKAAKKAANKTAKLAPEAGSPSPPVLAPVAPAPPANASGPSLPAMYLSSDGPGPLKCVTAARFFGVKVDAAGMNPAGESTTCMNTMQLLWHASEGT